MKTETIARKGFNYNGLAEKSTRATLKTEAVAIKAAFKRSHDNIIEIGNRLSHAKEVAGHGKFIEWIDAEFGMDRTMAWRFMSAAEAFANVAHVQHLPLSQNAIFALSAPSVSDEIRVEAIEAAHAGEIKTVADTKAFIEAKKAPPTVNGLQSNEPEPSSDSEPENQSKYPADEEGTSQAETEILLNGEAAPVTNNREHLVVDGKTVAEVQTPSKPSPTIEEQVEALPLYQSLELYAHGGHLFREQALLYFQIEKIVNSARAKKSLFEYKTGPVSDTISAVSKLLSPEFWEGCPSCKGSTRIGPRFDPCDRCKGGFTIRKGEGVNADVIRAHAESTSTST